jgi:hypothetical protein
LVTTFFVAKVSITTFFRPIFFSLPKFQSPTFQLSHNELSQRTIRGSMVFVQCFFWEIFIFLVQKVGGKKFVEIFFEMELQSIFQYFCYITTLIKISTPKNWKAWGHEMMGGMLFTYGVNMCKMKNHTMNKKFQYHTNFKFNHTWQHDSLIKLDFIKSTSSQHYNSYKLHQISYEPTTNSLLLPSIIFFKWSPIVLKPHQCSHNMLNNSLCL